MALACLALACRALALACLALALALPHSRHFEKVRLLEAWRGIGMPCLGLLWHVVPWPWHWHGVALACLGLDLPWHVVPWLGLGIAPFKAFRESEAIGSLAWRGLGMPCLGLRWHVVPWPCLGMSCLGLALALPHFGLSAYGRRLEACSLL